MKVKLRHFTLTTQQHSSNYDRENGLWHLEGKCIIALSYFSKVAKSSKYIFNKGAEYRLKRCYSNRIARRSIGLYLAII